MKQKSQAVSVLISALGCATISLSPFSVYFLSPLSEVLLSVGFFFFFFCFFFVLFFCFFLFFFFIVFFNTISSKNI